MSRAQASLLAAIPKPTGVVSTTAAVVQANRPFATLFGGSIEDVAQLSAAIARDASFCTPLTQAIGAVAAGRRAAAFQWTSHRDETMVYAVETASLDENQFLIMLDPVSDRLESETAFTQVRDYLDAILHHLPLGVLVLDADRKVTFCNRHQTQLLAALHLERPLIDLIGAEIHTIFPVLDRSTWMELTATAVDTLEDQSRLKIPYPSSSPSHYLNIRLLPLATRAITAGGTLCITEDVTRLVQLERDLVRSERLAVAGQMVAKYHHDINNPLVAILGTAELLLTRRALNEDVKIKLERMRSGALRIAEVTKKMRIIRDLARDQPDGTLPDLTIQPRVDEAEAVSTDVEPPKG